MAIPKQLVVVNDFSSGEVDLDVKRGGTSVTASGGRQMSNWRVLNSTKKANRPGRSVLFFETGRVDEISMSPGNKFFLAFGAGYLRVYNAAGTRVFSSTVKGDGSTAIPWTSSSIKSISFAVGTGTVLQVFIFYADGAPNNVPQILTWDGVSQTSAWTLATWAPTVDGSGAYRTLFYRLAAQGITLLPSNVTGTINITFSAPVLQAGMVGTLLTFCGQQLQIASVVSSTSGTATVIQQLPGTQILTLSGEVGDFSVGDVVVGSNSGATGIVTSGSSGSITVQIIQNASGVLLLFTTSDTADGPSGHAQVTAVSSASPAAVSVWAQQVMSSYFGYPSSAFYDQGRLGLCNFPNVPGAIAWSAIGLPQDFYIGVASADNAIFEFAPGKSQVLYVQPGMESSEFVFCDNAVYYIPISQAQPLTPGSVAFLLLSQEGCYPVQPRPAEQTILYMKAGGLQVGAVQAPGAYYRPYVIDIVAEFHSHLFTASPPIAIAVPSASAQFQELYAYILLADGTLVMGRYSIRGGLLDVGPEGKPKIGWLPWNGAGIVSWVSALGSDVIFTSIYQPGSAAVSVVEKLDATQYLDAAVQVNNLPAAITAAQPAGNGPLWWLADGTVFLIDLGTRFMGTYNVDASGWIIPRNQGGENLNSAQLIAGQPWTAVFEPFIPDAGAGQDARQRTRRRKIVRAAVTVENSSGFVYAATRIPYYVSGDDVEGAAPLREDTYRFRYPGRYFDPRVVLQKDTPGPLTVVEHAIEVTV